MFRKTFILLYSFCLCIPAHSQQDPQAKEILDRMAAKMDTYGTLHLTFILTTLDQQNKTEDSREGELYVKKEKYRMNFMDTESFFDGKTLWSYLPDVEEVTVTEPDPDEGYFFSNPSKLFSGYTREYKYRYMGKEEKTGNDILELVPNNLNLEYSKIRITVEPESSKLTSARYFGKDGVHYLLSVQSFETDSTKPDSFFVFEPARHPGTELIDMRF